MLMYSALSELGENWWVERCICIAKPIEGKILFFAYPKSPEKKPDTGQKIDWNDSGGQRPAQNQVKSKKEKVKK